MALVGIERIDDNKNKNNTDNNAMNRLTEMNNLNNINDKFSYREAGNVDSSGMYKGRLKVEDSVLSMSLSTLVGLLIFYTIIAAIIFFTLYFTKYKVEFFPILDSYSIDQYNTGLLRAVLILFGLLIFACFFVKISINSSIKKKLRKNYLNKSGIYVYDVFICFLNILFYLVLVVFFFLLVNSVHNSIINLNEADKFLGDVNVNLIELFKWVVVVITAIFLPLNCFKGIKIIHENHKFVLEDNFGE